MLANIKSFFKMEAISGILLMIFAIIAMVVENSPLSKVDDLILNTHFTIKFGDHGLSKPLILWINDGLMSLFFLLVGLEIKREIRDGELSKKEQITLPLIAALGGVVFPALIYVGVNLGYGNGEHVQGWAIPSATDIAFALGIVLVLGKRVPDELKICLMAIAIFDDLVAIIIIALFYSEQLSVMYLGLTVFTLGVLYLMNKYHITKISAYLFVGVFLWVFVLNSGIHATLAGVMLAYFIPFKKFNKWGRSPLKILEKKLHPWVTFLVLPLFALCNAGVSLKYISLETLLNPITIGICSGLFFGKQIGVMLFTYLGTKFKFCELPNSVSWVQYYGMALVTGVGFTMSLFVGTLAFEDTQEQNFVRTGVLIGSLLSGVLGYSVLRVCGNKKKK